MFIMPIAHFCFDLYFDLLRIKYPDFCCLFQLPSIQILTPFPVFTGCSMLFEPPSDSRDGYNFPAFSIFSPEPVEAVEEIDEVEKLDTFERPPSPLEEVIQKPPPLYENFLEILQERIKPTQACTKLPVEKQEGLISIIFSEVYSRWSDLCEDINDPQLTGAQNKKVHILLFINVVNICQDLFETYLNRIDKLEHKGVFSKSVNTSRVKGCLIAEASKALNIHRLRQKILLEFRQSGTSAPSTRKTAADDDLFKDDFPTFFEHLMSKAAPISVDPALTRTVSEIENKLRTPTALSQKSGSAKSRAKSSILGTVPEEGEETIEHAPLDHQDSIMIRHRDLEFLLSEHRIPQVSVADEEEEELSAVLQASTKAAIPKRERVFSKHSIKSALSEELVSTENLPVQPAITAKVMPDKTVVKTSDIRVSERVPQSNMILDIAPCRYNELLNEIDETDIAFLDRNLFMGQEIKDVYSEIYKTISHQHITFTSDMEAPCPQLPSPDKYFNSGVLARKKVKNKRINNTIKTATNPPWGDSTRDDWEANLHFQGGDSTGEISDIFPSQLIKVPVFSDWDSNNFKATQDAKTSREGKSYTNWLQWWKSIISGDDYLKYMSLRESDYLALVFHLYDSEEEVDSADERDLQLENDLAKEREKRDHLLQVMLEEKNKVVPGYWNANSVMMGGLGKDPELDDGDISGELTPEKLSQLVLSNPTLKRDLRVKSSGSRSSVGASKSIRSKDSKALDTIASTVEGAVTTAAVEAKSLQDRLNNIWRKLEMPEEHQIDMTIKYCKHEPESLRNVVDLWENACEAVANREKLIMELESFEKYASDPHRLFSKTNKSSRMAEEKKRSSLHRRLKRCEKELAGHVLNVGEELGDVVTYQGRVYQEKMSRDVTEMLYWLQQERRQLALEGGGMVMVDLPPVSPADLV